LTSEPLRSPLPGDPEAIHRWLEGSNPGHYRQLALYLQVLREVLPHSVDLAIHHLVTQLQPGRYASLDSSQRAQFHRRVVDLVGRCSSLLTVEQLTSLAARIARERQREHRRQQRRLLQRLQAADHDEDGASEDDLDPAEEVAAPPPLFSWGFEAEGDPLPPGSVRLGMAPPMQRDLLGWFEGAGLGSERSHRHGEPLGEEGDDALADLFDALGDNGLNAELHDHADDPFDGGPIDQGHHDAASDIHSHDDSDVDSSFESGLDKAFDSGFDRAFEQAFESGFDPGFDSGFGSDRGIADHRDQAENHAGAEFPDQPSGRDGSEVMEGAMAAWSLLRGSSGAGRSERRDPADLEEDGDPEDGDDISAWLPGASSGGLLPREPLALLAWLELHELALARRLRNLSHALNVELLRAGLLQALLPASLLDAVLEGRIDPQGAPPNLLRLQLPMALPGLENPLQATVVLLRCGDLELEQPRLRTVRRELQRRRQESRRMAQHYRRLQRRLQAREAEALWLQDIHQRRPGPPTPSDPPSPPGRP